MIGTSYLDILRHFFLRQLDTKTYLPQFIRTFSDNKGNILSLNSTLFNKQNQAENVYSCTGVRDLEPYKHIAM